MSRRGGDAASARAAASPRTVTTRQAVPMMTLSHFKRCRASRYPAYSRVDEGALRVDRAHRFSRRDCAKGSAESESQPPNESFWEGKRPSRLRNPRCRIR